MNFQALHQDIANNIDNINCGGCGVFASLLAKKLPNAKIAVFERHNTVEELLENNEAMSHCMVEWDNKYIDGKIVVNKSEAFQWNDVPFNGYINLSDLETLLQYKSTWNPTFNRNQIPKLQEIIEQHTG
jgi:hypothetical protein